MTTKAEYRARADELSQLRAKRREWERVGNFAAAKRADTEILSLLLKWRAEVRRPVRLLDEAEAAAWMLIGARNAEARGETEKATGSRERVDKIAARERLKAGAREGRYVLLDKPRGCTALEEPEAPPKSRYVTLLKPPVVEQEEIELPMPTRFTVAGYAAVFGEIGVTASGKSYNEIVDRGSFDEGQHSEPLTLQFERHGGACVGFTSEIWQDDYGVAFEGEIQTTVDEGKRLFDWLTTGGSVRCSIGWTAPVIKGIGDVRHVTQLGRCDHICLTSSARYPSTCCWLSDPELALSRGYGRPAEFDAIAARWKEGRAAYHARCAAQQAAAETKYQVEPSIIRGFA